MIHMQTVDVPHGPRRLSNRQLRSFARCVTSRYGMNATINDALISLGELGLVITSDDLTALERELHREQTALHDQLPPAEGSVMAVAADVGS